MMRYDDDYNFPDDLVESLLLMVRDLLIKMFGNYSNDMNDNYDKMMGMFGRIKLPLK
jgi:hypothetical protein